jgi:hypothetical protein
MILIERNANHVRVNRIGIVVVVVVDFSSRVVIVGFKIVVVVIFSL